MSEYRVDLEAYNGPLDLLLYLIRRDEIEIYDIPIARVTKQYLQFVDVLHALDPNLAGDFLVMIATLMEIKSRALLPRHLDDGADQEDLADPRLELVRQLLAYKTFKDAAHELGLSAQVHALRFPRQPVLPETNPDDVDLEDVSIWTLMQAFAALLEQTGKAKPTHDVMFDETPMALHAADVIDSLQRGEGSQAFASVFAGRTRAEMIGLFLALLELIRQRRIRVTQDEPFGPIIVHLLDPTPIEDILDEPWPAPSSAGEQAEPPQASAVADSDDEESNPDDAGDDIRDLELHELPWDRIDSSEDTERSQ